MLLKSLSFANLLQMIHTDGSRSSMEKLWDYLKKNF